VAERVRVLCAADPVPRAAALLARAVAAVDRRRGRARLAVPGGSAVAALGPARRALASAWSRACLTWVDERCVPAADAASNRGAAYRCGALDPAQPPACELPLFLDGETAAQAVARVEGALAGPFQGALDVLLLGLGEDGHIASLFEGWSAPAGARVARVTNSPKPPRRRITLTPAILASAARAILLAAGPGKRAALERVVAGDPALPTRALRGLIIVTDQRLAKCAP
jgi:6-phosphogluconolactonase